MKKSLIKKFLGLAISVFLIFTIVLHYKIALKKAYDEGVFWGYAEGYLKHKYYPENNDFFVRDEKHLDYLSVLTKVYITSDKVYHRKGCVSHGEVVIIKDIFNEYSPCTSCQPPIVLQ